jgi:glycosyltransferase involved in cell wall biosynthesis
VDGEHLLIADAPETFAEKVIELLDDAQRRASLGDRGRALVEERYSWDYCGAQLLAALDAAQENGWRV